MTPKEQQRLQVLNRVLEGGMTVPTAAGLMGLSERQAWRVLAAYRKEGAAALAHGNRGHTPWNRVPQEVRDRVVALARDPRYRNCNHTHFAELLEEREELRVTRPTVRRILLAAGLPSPRRRRAPKHRSRRERLPQEGMLLQWDGSPHAWLEGRGPRLTLIGAIDDATGVPVAARFRLQEDAQGYLLVLRDILQRKGIPLAIYRDRHGLFQRGEHDRWTLAEELAGERLLTQVGRALAEVGITSIAAHSPQAKGRVERVWETWQDRLVIELRLAEACTLEQADRVLQDYLPHFAQRFGVPAAQPGSAYRPLPAQLDPDTVCCFKYQRTVGNDHVVPLGDQRLQIQPDGQRASYARTTVEVQERLDGRVAVYYQDRCLLVTAAPPEAPLLRARKGRRAPLPLRRRPGQPAAVAVTGPVGKGATRAPADPVAPETVVHLPTGGQPPKPGAGHPWRKPLKRTALTKSLNR